MTEKEAKTCACTISEMYTEEGVRLTPNTVKFKWKCIASNCGMWKWLEDSCSLLCYNVPLKSVGHCPFSERVLDLTF
jgi:hypothetical protein